MAKKLLLISNSKSYGLDYLDHVKEEIKDFLNPVVDVVFIPYADDDEKGYTEFVKKKFEEIDITIHSIVSGQTPEKTIESAKAVFVGGGNTFRLLDKLYKNNLIKIMSEKVSGGMIYIGSSAGSNVACPTIKTTNDMPIVYPQSFDALNLVNFQINPHYIDVDTYSKHMGETREQRIKEFLEENDIPVIGLREGAWLTIEDDVILLKGKNGARLFKRNELFKELELNKVVTIKE